MVFTWLYRLIYPAALFLLSCFSFLNPKLKKGFQLRKKINGVKPWLNFPENSQPLWFHCSSGEYEYAKPVIRALKAKNPDQKIMVTFFSPSVEKSLAKADDIDFYCPTPWDSLKNWNEFIKHHKPRALLIARTDLWPMMLEASKKNKLPSLLFSKTTQSQKNGFQKTMMRWLYPKIQEVFCVTEEDRQNLFSQIRPYKNIHAAGDTRYDQCLHRLQNGNPLKPLNNFLKPVFIAGSTWSSDEKVLLPLIKEKIQDVAFIVAPHEPSKKHLQELTQSLTYLGVPFQLYSEAASWDPFAVLIIDQVGILADLYSWGQFAFVGGSMDRSVHSVMEPLALGLLTFVGPKNGNNREAQIFKSEKIKDVASVQEIRNSSELREKFNELSQSWTNNHQLDLKIAIQNRAGASEIVLKWIAKNQKDSTIV